jgi:hypothetical protein
MSQTLTALFEFLKIIAGKGLTTCGSFFIISFLCCRCSDAKRSGTGVVE